MPFVVESVTARLHFTGFHSSVRAFCHHRRTCIEKPAADPAQVIAFLLSGSPSEERGRHTVPADPAILTDADTVAVKSHCHTTVGVACVDEVAGHIKIVLYDVREGLVGFLVGMVRSPVAQGLHLLPADGVS